MHENKSEIEFLSFKNHNIPLPAENNLLINDDRMVDYGIDNLYPNFILKLYAESPIHSAIINSKVTHILGEGLVNSKGKLIDVKVNPADGFNEFISKCIKDYLLFNAFAVEVCFNAFGEVIEYHFIPVHKIRTNRLKNKFWYNDYWLTRKNTITYERFTPNSKDTTSKIFYFDGYFPNVNNVYPVPEYNGCLKSIVTAIAIRDFNLNNIKNNFSVSTLITFFNGSNVSEEVKRNLVRKIQDSYTSENGGKIIIDFQNPESKPAEVKNISPGEWDKAYNEIAKNVTDDILIGHAVTSPMLMGIKTEGQLGGATELETAYQIWKNNYIKGKRAEILSAFNYLFQNSTIITDSLTFQDKPLFNTEISDEIKKQIFTINELRKEAGLPPLTNGDRLLNEQPVSTPSEPQFKEDVKKNSSWEKRELTEDDFESIKDLGLIKEDFEIISEGKFVLSADHANQIQLQFDKQKDISGWLLENDIRNLTIDGIVDKLNNAGIETTASELTSTLKELQEANILKVAIEDGKVSVMPNKVADIPDTGRIITMYDYVKRPSASGDILIPTSRGFCKKLVSNNKYYSRQDIQSMSGIFGYDVFTHCGGFWHNKDTDEVNIHCRHMWKSVTLRRKNNEQ